MERSIVKLFENLVAFLIFLIVPESVWFVKRRRLTTMTV